VARTLVSDDGGDWIQVERGARPAQAVILVEEKMLSPGDRRTMSVSLLPSRTLFEHTGGYTPTEAKRVAGTLLPDVLSYDLCARHLFLTMADTHDHAFDVFIRILTQWKGDGRQRRGPWRPVLAFPYVGPPHQGPRDESAP